MRQVGALLMVGAKVGASIEACAVQKRAFSAQGDGRNGGEREGARPARHGRRRRDGGGWMTIPPHFPDKERRPTLCFRGRTERGMAFRRARPVRIDRCGEANRTLYGAPNECRVK